MRPSHNELLYFPSGRVRESEKSTLKNQVRKEGNITSSCCKYCWWVLSQVLGIAHHNLSYIVEQQQLLQNFGLSPFALLERRKRQEGVSTKTKNLVILWWAVETQVKPQPKKCHMQKHLTWNQYEAYATHFLLESQVRFNLGTEFGILLINHKDSVHWQWLFFNYSFIMLRLGDGLERIIGLWMGNDDAF